ncbi:Nucleoside diphosphate-linked moiety X motif 17 [Fasciolopsis buskii]|uniref:Nucleoside diphosphate-linked moiety X motif 17 n=1 Tax=Fasciolopsis buskii TaxID=27845 RepID=A0A8E0VLX7_9TREM|nr:Nucleoside diphosphate-linked moiety X motif 17 [Fasciolopsis buski]
MLQRPSYCPFASRNRMMRSHISFVNRPPGREHIPVAGACLLESPNQEALLLTKRPWHMRTYPGLWVPPGGHSEPGELIQTTALRELCEEIGVTSLIPEQWIPQTSVTMKPLCAWEAAYPAIEAPQSHHLVLYYVTPWPSWLMPHVDLPLPKVDPPSSEVQSIVWLPRSVLNVLYQDWLQFDAFWREKLLAISTSHGHEQLLAPDPSPVTRLRTPVWVWDVQISRWEQKPVNQLIQSLSTPETCNPNQLMAPELSKIQSSSLSVGTLYAIGNWLLHR